MKIQDVRMLMELQALQGFSGVESPDTEESGNLFQEALETAIGLGKENSVSQKLGGLVDILTNKNTLENMLDHIPVKSMKEVTLPTKIPEALPPESLQVTKDDVPSDIEDIIEKAANLYNLPAKLLKSVIKHESNFNPNATSHAGATGLMQLMPSTARGLGVKNIFDPFENVLGGSKYLRQMLDRYDGDIKLALAAYNAGPGNVDKHGGIPPFRETQNYVKKIMGTFSA
ncbi:lytic transglycosylase domain-containing protein [Bacillus sp. V5-8f]|uniref:lytic transglycosylase domain-containing protein n=1 Tax=Bacillus sp. V5-8f TaxID=2053044 RepID=UPI000C77A2C5|nr:lytic transglycosylase domain-containing protein [Bacillus sp. V5-8f]PLT33884.1 lytic transglycosylase [Bacillus sp. V5-8f]